MAKYSWVGGIENHVSLEVVACRGSMAEPPSDLVINGDEGHFDIDASERFMVILKINGKWIASVHAHEVIKQVWEK